jgi:cytochrome c oxidase assembly factor CtaG
MKRLFVVASATTPLLAHDGEAPLPRDIWKAWSFDPGVVVPLVLVAVLYACGASAKHGVSNRQQLYFWSGWFVLSMALLSPLHPLGESLFFAHMIQHELLMVVAAPLLVLSRPVVALLWGLPPGCRRVFGQWSKRAAFQASWRFATHPMTAWWIHATALWVWHTPRLFEATLRNDWVHSAQHLSFLGSALLFWWSLFYAHGKALYGASVLYVFTTAVHTSILGALLTFASTVWYPAYLTTTSTWGLTAIEDQQTGGLIMWIPAGLAYVVAGLALFAGWLRESERIVMRPKCQAKGEYAA